MRYIYAAIMYSCFVIACYYASRIFVNQNYKKLSYRVLTMASISSGIWSFGYSMMFAFSSESVFPVFRAIGLLGIILFLLIGQGIIGMLSNRMRLIYLLVIPEAIIGIVVYALVVLPSAYRMILTEKGIITEFTSVAISTVYTVYFVIIAVIFIIISVMLAHDKNSKKNAMIGRVLLKMEALVIFGMIIDTLLPAFGVNFNIPASSILQSGGLFIFHNAVEKYNQNSINEENVVHYIRKVIKTPIYIFNVKDELCLANDAAIKRLNVQPNEKVKDIDIWQRALYRERPDMDFFAKEGFVLDCIDEEHDLYSRLSVDPIYDEYNDAIGYIISESDLTDHVKNLHLEASTNMKTQFLANMSHEIRTPLNAILGFNEAIVQNASDVEKVRSYASSIHDAGNNLKEIINSILDISKIEMGQLQIDSKEYSTVELLDNISSMFELLANKKGLEFKTNIDPGLPEIMLGDEQHLKQVLINILNNAVKYTDEGSVTFSVSVVHRSKDTALNRIRFSVKDTGRGIKEQDREKLFAKFERLDTEHFKHTEGTGLGMSIVLFTLRAMDSEIQFDSVFGEGSDFYFELEQIAMNETEIGDFNERRKENALKEVKSIQFRAPRARALIVDDVEMNLDAAIALLEFTQMTVDKALSGKEALEKVQKEHYDIIFMDHMMPEMDGIEATQKIHDLAMLTNDVYYACVPIIALTANALVGAREMYQEAGMQDFISKPIEINNVITALKKWLPQELIESASEEDLKLYEESGKHEQDISEANLQIEGIDSAEARKYNANLEGLYKNMNSFIRAYEGNRKEITQYFDFGDVQNYVIKVHGLKSTSKMIGAMTLSEKAKLVEEAGNQGQMSEADFDELMSLYLSCVEQLKAYFDSLDKDKEEAAAISEEEYQALLVRIKNAADAFDAMEFMTLDEELSGICVDASHKEDFEQIQNMVSLIQYGALSEFIAKIV